MAKKQAVAVPSPSRLRDLAEKGGTDLLKFSPNTIVIEKNHNPRNYSLTENRQHLDELKASILLHGVMQPLWVRYDGGQAILVDGECRLRACLELMKEGKVPAEFRVPVMQVQGLNEQQRLIKALTANTGKSLSMWEVGTAYQKLVGWGMEPEEIAKQMGQSSAYVHAALTLSDAPEEVKQMLSEKAITPSLAVVKLKKFGSKAGAELKKDAAKAKAAGKKTATAERTIGVNAYEVLGKQIAKRLEQDKETDMIAEGKADDESVTVPYLLAKKLLDLYRGIKPEKKAKK